ncbi:SPFH domain-containing protein [Actinocrinis sp.]|uniref:SPFH domain-containing protein n=1 Tax=Actinocrinis sp. TaxID=1920516 RepID=UPI002B6A9EE5|nr:SPFH domain-containing protein [Actinocrinis sp.]HXR72082.1 SPFH domain-containing protein [Actinocrinis sp.]
MSVVTAILVVLIVVLSVTYFLYRSVQIVPQASAQVVERFGRYRRTLEPGLRFLVPVADTIRATVDMREQVVPFPPQEVITEDNLLVYIDWVVYYQVTDPRRATYEIQNYVQAIEYLVSTTLRNIVGGMDLERTLTSRDEVNTELRDALDQATGPWGIRVNRVELRTIQPNRDITEAMEKQVRAERERRATVLQAEGVKQAEILRAEGDRQSMILKAEGEAKAAELRAGGEAQAIKKVFEAIHEGDADSKLLSYQYLQMLPKLAEGEANKVWIVPSELGKAVEGIGGAFSKIGAPQANGEPGPGSGPGNSGGGGGEGGDPARPAGPRPSAAPAAPAASGPTREPADRPAHTTPRPRRLSPADVLYGAEDE